VNRRYLAIRGMLTEVGGKIFETRSRKTTRARRIETQKDTPWRTIGKPRRTLGIETK